VFDFSRPPGTATEKDVLTIQQREKRNCELIDGVLVEKPMEFLESNLAGWLLHLLYQFLAEHDLGMLAGESGPVRLMPGLVRMPDVSFVSWEQLGKHEVPQTPIPDLYPDLAIEVLSPGNTKEEMDRKVREYFLAGTRLVWLVDPRKRSVRICTAPDRSRLLKEHQTLDGGEVLPGLSLPLREVFTRTPRQQRRKKSSGR
jgi:Uma2 family endonuclease